MFLLFSWLVTISPQIRGTLSGVARASIIEWPLMFFSQATLIPVYQAVTFNFSIRGVCILSGKSNFTESKS